MPGPRTAVDEQVELRDALVPVGEGHDVAHVGAAPLVDRLVVIADHDEVGSAVRLGQQLDQSLLGRVDVLVLVDDQVPQALPSPARGSSGSSSARTASTICVPNDMKR